MFDLKQVYYPSYQFYFDITSSEGPYLGGFINYIMEPGELDEILSDPNFGINDLFPSDWRHIKEKMTLVDVCDTIIKEGDIDMNDTECWVIYIRSTLIKRGGLTRAEVEQIMNIKSRL